MFGHNHRCVWHFDLLDRVEFAGRSQLQTLNFVVLDFVVDGLVDTFWRERLVQLSLATFLPASFGFRATLCLLFGRLDNIAGGRFRGVRRVFHRLGKMQL